MSQKNLSKNTPQSTPQIAPANKKDDDDLADFKEKVSVANEAEVNTTANVLSASQSNPTYDHAYFRNKTLDRYPNLQIIQIQIRRFVQHLSTNITSVPYQNSQQFLFTLESSFDHLPTGNFDKIY
ncbi:hypothetical protein RhiirC2_784822 [Rhizophagus irregularis]|uniref:Uncharacterized protein n=1 Tax=Rhizophagus irregularis TaxID=588596 RepID=A0A2N1MXQ6_9GLOM|nr:hypothetical protein RhiirC2_784822 [Rhizophagus irregularis]